METFVFDWDRHKNELNIAKHDVSFILATQAFYDANRLIAKDVDHSTASETRYYCFGKVGDDILTVRFTYRSEHIRIFGAGCWRKGRKAYEKENQIH